MSSKSQPSPRARPEHGGSRCRLTTPADDVLRLHLAAAVVLERSERRGLGDRHAGREPVDRARGHVDDVGTHATAQHPASRHSHRRSPSGTRRACSRVTGTDAALSMTTSQPGHRVAHGPSVAHVTLAPLLLRGGSSPAGPATSSRSTSQPASLMASAMFEPRNPAPPVIKARGTDPPWCCPGGAGPPRGTGGRGRAAGGAAPRSRRTPRTRGHRRAPPGPGRRGAPARRRCGRAGGSTGTADAVRAISFTSTWPPGSTSR